MFWLSRKNDSEKGRIDHFEVYRAFVKKYTDEQLEYDLGQYVFKHTAAEIVSELKEKANTPSDFELFDVDYLKWMQLRALMALNGKIAKYDAERGVWISVPKKIINPAEREMAFKAKFEFMKWLSHELKSRGVDPIVYLPLAHYVRTKGRKGYYDAKVRSETVPLERLTEAPKQGYYTWQVAADVKGLIFV